MTVSLRGLERVELDAPLAQGASAQVWRAHHVYTQHPLAIKLLRPDQAQLGAMLLREADALARLDHRHVATIYDLGQLEQPLKLPQGGVELPASTPYLIMELATQGTCLSRRGRLSQGQLVVLLEQTLGALAHIHAHGLLHLDIKPTNVLLTAHEHLEQAQVRVVDMGLGAWLGQGAHASGGTLDYMAPEQLAASLGALGPWTDLFALGVMALEFLCDERPLAAQTIEQAQAMREPAALQDALERAPTLWRPWLQGCMARSPALRWRSAAAARAGLLALAQRASWALEPLALEPSGALQAPTMAQMTQYSTVISLRPLTLPQALALEPVPEPEPGATSPRASASASALAHGDVAGAVAAQGPEPAQDPVAWPESWAQPHPSKPLHRLAQLGSGLFSRRTPRQVGRVAQRDRLWRRLGESAAQGQAALSAVVGDSGQGVSALARWLGQRAAELADVAVLQAVEAPGQPGREALLALARALMALPDAPVEPASRHAFQALERAAMAAAFGGRSLMEDSPLESLCLTLLEQVSRRRRVLIWFEDAPASGALWSLMTRAASQGAPTGGQQVMILGVGEVGALGAKLDALASPQRPGALGVEVIRLGPLRPEELAVLIHQSLGLDPVVIEELATRAQGSPGVALGIIAQWLSRGWLEPGPRGLTLTSWQHPWLDAEDLGLEAQLEATLRGSSRLERAALAALSLGGWRAQASWLERALVDEAADEPPGELKRALERLVAQGVLQLEPDGALGWRRQAQRAWLERRFAPERAALAARVVSITREGDSAQAWRAPARRAWEAGVWAAAGRPDQALGALRALLVAGMDTEIAASCLAILEQLEARLSEPQQRHEALLLRARCMYALGDHSADEALRELRLAPAAPASLRFALRELRLIAALSRGEFTAAQALGQGLLEELDAQESPALVTRAHAALARLGIHTKRYEDAIYHGRRALAGSAALGEPTLELATRNIVAIALMEHHQADEARQHLEACIELAQALGSSKFEVMALNTLGDLEMRLSRWELARSCFMRGLLVSQERYPLAAYLRGNLAWIALNLEQPELALAQLDEALARLDQAPSIVRLYLLELRQGACAMLGQALAWDQSMDALEALMRRVAAAHEEGAAAAKLSAQRWAVRQDAARAARASDLEARLRALLAGQAPSSS